MDLPDLPTVEELEFLYVMQATGPGWWTAQFCDDRFTVTIQNPGPEAIMDVWVDDRDTLVPAWMIKRGQKVATVGSRGKDAHWVCVFAVKAMRDFAAGEKDMWADHPNRPPGHR